MHMHMCMCMCMSLNPISSQSLTVIYNFIYLPGFFQVLQYARKIPGIFADFGLAYFGPK